MKGRAAFWLAWGLGGMALALILASVVLAVPNRYGLGNVSFLIAEASAALVGALISWRQPRNPVGWFILAHALCFTLGEFTRQYAIFGVQTIPGSLPFAREAIWPAYWIWFPGLVLMVALLPVYFPNGRLLSRRWRWAVWLTILFTTLATGIVMFQPGDGEAAGIPNPLGSEVMSGGREPLTDAVESAMQLGWLLLGVVAAASLVMRFRRALGEERQQIKWVAYALIFTLAYFASNQLFLYGRLPEILEEAFLLLALLALWISFAVAILRYRLYDIDLLINRTLVYAILSATLVGVYVVGVVVLQYLFGVLAGGGSGLAVVASTLAIAALFNPLRKRIQGEVDRRFYRQKYDAARTLEAFGARLRDRTDLDGLNAELLAVVRETVQPERVSLWMREPRNGSPESGVGNREGLDPSSRRGTDC